VTSPTPKRRSADTSPTLKLLAKRDLEGKKVDGKMKYRKRQAVAVAARSRRLKQVLRSKRRKPRSGLAESLGMEPVKMCESGRLEVQNVATSASPWTVSAIHEFTGT
jgi:hypothetical protein